MFTYWLIWGLISLCSPDWPGTLWLRDAPEDVCRCTQQQFSVATSTLTTRALAAEPLPGMCPSRMCSSTLWQRKRKIHFRSWSQISVLSPWPVGDNGEHVGEEGLHLKEHRKQRKRRNGDRCSFQGDDLVTHFFLRFPGQHAACAGAPCRP